MARISKPTVGPPAPGALQNFNIKNAYGEIYNLVLWTNHYIPIFPLPLLLNEELQKSLASSIVYQQRQGK